MMPDYGLRRLFAVLTLPYVLLYVGWLWLREKQCSWFGHKWTRGVWLSGLGSDPLKYRTDFCVRCDAKASWYVLDKDKQSRRSP